MSPTTAVLSAGKLCQRFFSAPAYYCKLVAICSLCKVLFCGWKEMLPTILLGFLLYTSISKLDVRIVQREMRIFALQMSPPHSVLADIPYGARLTLNIWVSPGIGLDKRHNDAKAHKHTCIPTQAILVSPHSLRQLQGSLRDVPLRYLISVACSVAKIHISESDKICT